MKYKIQFSHWEYFNDDGQPEVASDQMVAGYNVFDYLAKEFLNRKYCSEFEANLYLDKYDKGADCHGIYAVFQVVPIGIDQFNFIARGGSPSEGIPEWQEVIQITTTENLPDPDEFREFMRNCLKEWFDTQSVEST